MKHALKYGQKGAVRLAVIDRRTEDEGICTVHFRGYSVANVIVERTGSGSVLATSAADAATQRLVAYPSYLAIDAVHRELLRNLCQSNVCVALLTGAAVDHQYFHVIEPLL